MFIEVLRPFEAQGQQLQVGQIVDATGWRLVDQLARHRMVRAVHGAHPAYAATQQAATQQAATQQAATQQAATQATSEAAAHTAAAHTQETKRQKAHG